MDDTPTYDCILTIDNSVERPTHDTNIVATCFYSGRIIRTITIVAVDDVIPLDIFELSPHAVDNFPFPLPADMTPDG